MSQEPNFEMAIAVGRIEEMLKAMSDKLDKLETSSDNQWKKLNEHETEIQLLKERQGPKVHVITWLIGIVAVASLALSLLDRIFVAQ